MRGVGPSRPFGGGDEACGHEAVIRCRCRGADQARNRAASLCDGHFFATADGVEPAAEVVSEFTDAHFQTVHLPSPLRYIFADILDHTCPRASSLLIGLNPP